MLTATRTTTRMMMMMKTTNTRKGRRRSHGEVSPRTTTLLLLPPPLLFLLLVNGARGCNAAAAAASSSSSSSSLSAEASAAQPTHLSPACPAACECSEQARTVKCVARELTEPPRGLPGYTRTLFLTGNVVSSLGAGGAFARDAVPPLHSLTTLNLSSNRVERVDGGAFAGLTALRVLDLSNNAIRSVHPAAFSGLVSLQELILNRALSRGHRRHNATSESPPSPPPPPSPPSPPRSPSEESPPPPPPPRPPWPWSCLNGLCEALRSGRLLALQRLSLQGNRLLVLPPRYVLRSLPSLATLDLSNNSISSGVGADSGLDSLPALTSLDLSDNAFASPDAAQLELLRRAAPGLALRLGANPLVCDCDIRPFAAWLGNATGWVKDAGHLRCRHPPALRGRPLAELLPGGGGGGGGEEEEPLLPCAGKEVPAALHTSYVFLGLVLALVGLVFLLVLYLNRRGIKLWAEGVRDLCRDHMEASYHYRYEHEAPEIGGDMRRLSATAEA
ncbi:trophoblast glycoprotein [Petromyzon marinus]|uniref:trophoblast glycoprotein n=1 Tax=Petromyzon marinus TaxID=7757 RepID=UPI003F6F989E